MNARTLFERRFSCRSFDTTPLDRETVEAVLEAARWAPNGGNLQPWRFVVVLDSIRRRALAGAAYGQDFLAQAPVVITVCAVPDESATKYGPRGRELYCLQDTAAAAQNIQCPRWGRWIDERDRSGALDCVAISVGNP